MKTLVINVIETKRIHGHRTTGRPASYRFGERRRCQGNVNSRSRSLDVM
jgi:hypothetical protein